MGTMLCSSMKHGYKVKIDDLLYYLQINHYFEDIRWFNPQGEYILIDSLYDYLTNENHEDDEGFIIIGVECADISIYHDSYNLIELTKLTEKEVRAYIINLYSINDEEVATGAYRLGNCIVKYIKEKEIKLGYYIYGNN